jgi:hydrogenase-4 component E
VLLDLFTGVFVMGIIIHHISREFDSISTDYLAELKE